MLSRFIKRLSRPSIPDPAPSHRLWAVGDVHGCLDLLLLLLDRIRQDVADHPDEDPVVVLLGDYVDRGPDSAGVLRLLMDPPDPLPARIVLLRGNHEQMMLDALRDPVRRGRRWLRYGGRDTLRSFGLPDTRPDAGPTALCAMADDLRAAMPDGMEAWLEGLPTTWQAGNVVCVHAGLDPARPVAAQEDATPIWGHEDFFRIQRRDGLWVVHGHTIVAEPSFEAGRIATDTGAYEGGPLTAVCVEPGGIVRFERASGSAVL